MPVAAEHWQQTHRDQEKHWTGDIPWWEFPAHLLPWTTAMGVVHGTYPSQSRALTRVPLQAELAAVSSLLQFLLLKSKNTDWMKPTGEAGTKEVSTSLPGTAREQCRAVLPKNDPKHSLRHLHFRGAQDCTPEHGTAKLSGVHFGVLTPYFYLFSVSQPESVLPLFLHH